MAHAFNQLPTAPPTPPLACAMGRTVNATITSPNGRWGFIPNCNGIGVTFNGTPQPELENSWDLEPVREAYYAFFASPPQDGFSASAAPNPDDPQPSLILTGADNGRTVTVAVGTVVRVDLSVPPPTTVAAVLSDDAVMQEVDSTGGLEPASHALFRAVASGNANLIALTYPVCLTQPGCGAAPAFTFHILVNQKH